MELDPGHVEQFYSLLLRQDHGSWRCHHLKLSKTSRNCRLQAIQSSKSSHLVCYHFQCCKEGAGKYYNTGPKWILFVLCQLEGKFLLIFQWTSGSCQTCFKRCLSSFVLGFGLRHSIESQYKLRKISHLRCLAWGHTVKRKDHSEFRWLS